MLLPGRTLRWKLNARKSAMKLGCLALNQVFIMTLPKQEPDKATKGNRRKVVFAKRNNLKQRSMAYLGYERSFAINRGFVRQKWYVLTGMIILE